MRLRACDRMHLKTARIKRLCDPLDIASLACCIPSFIGNDHRNSLSVQTVVKTSKLRLQFLKLCLVLLLFHFFSFKRDLIELWHLHQWENILQDRNRMFAVFHSDLNIADHRLQYLQLCPFPVTGIYDIPWRRGSIGISHILIKNFSAFFIMIILPEIIFIHSPARILALQEIFHSFLLFFTVDLHKKFQENISVISQLTLKSANTVDPLHITVTFQFLVHTVAAGLVHPSGIQKCEFAIFRNFLEIPVKKRSP